MRTTRQVLDAVHAGSDVDVDDLRRALVSLWGVTSPTLRILAVGEPDRCRAQAGVLAAALDQELDVRVPRGRGGRRRRQVGVVAGSGYPDPRR